MGLACLNNSMGRQGSETCYTRISRSCTGYLDKAGCSARGSYPRDKGNSWLGHSSPSQFQQMSRQYIILRLNFWSFKVSVSDVWLECFYRHVGNCKIRQYEK